MNTTGLRFLKAKVLFPVSVPFSQLACSPVVLTWVLLAAAATCPGTLPAQEELDPELLRPGVLLEIHDATGRSALRHEHHLRWHQQPPEVDPRLGSGPWRLRFHGVLQVVEPGRYRFFVQGSRVRRLLLDGKPVPLQAISPTWHAGKELELPFGFHRLELELKLEQAEPVGLFWQGPRWPVEPVPPGRLFHQEQPQASWFQQGALLARAFRCEACHGRQQAAAAPLPGPALDQVARNYRYQWLVDYLQSKPDHDRGASEEDEDDEELGPFAPGPRWWALRFEPARRMPHFGLSARQAQAVAAYLWVASAGKPQAAREKTGSARSKNDPALPGLKPGARQTPRAGKATTSVGEPAALYVFSRPVHGPSTWRFRTRQEQNVFVRNNVPGEPAAHQEVRPPGAAAPVQEQTPKDTTGRARLLPSRNSGQRASFHEAFTHKKAPPEHTIIDNAPSTLVASSAGASVQQKSAKQTAGSASRKNSRPTPSKRGKRSRNKRPRPSAAQGRRLLLTLGCLACHSYQGQGQRGLFAGGELAQVAAKRPQEFFARWLENPRQCNADARMPRYELAPHERQSLVLFLQQQGRGQGGNGPTPKQLSATLVQQGRQLVRRFRCGACHRLPQEEKLPQGLPPLAEASRWKQGCLGSPDPVRGRPGYELPREARQILRHYYVQLSRAAASAGKNARGSTAPGLEHGWLLLVEHNCTGCHARDRFQGIEPVAQQLAAQQAELGQVLPAMKPPALLSVGDKLTNPALEEALLGRRHPVRPWLVVRMPRFELSAEERRELAAYLKAKDRVPPEAPAPEVDLQHTTREQLLAAGARLVTGSGFGCTSCHQVGPVEPGQVELKSRGPDLALLGRRVRRNWYWRWMPNPSRLVPRMEMPALVSPVPGVLQGDLSRQLEAVWRVLNLPEFRPPKPDPVRVVRRRNDPRHPEEPAVVLTDVVELDPQGRSAFLKPLLVGLPNRHNVLLDLATGRLGAWWLGDVAYQRTRGKTWYWEPGSVPLWAAAQSDAPAPLVLYHRQRKLLPARRGQFVTEVDAWEHIPAGVRFRYRLLLTPGGKALGPEEKPPPESVLLTVEETWRVPAPLGSAEADRTWVRQLRLRGVPAGARLVFSPGAAPWKWQTGKAKGTQALTARGPGCTVELHPARTGPGQEKPLAWHLAQGGPTLAALPGGELRWRVVYRAAFSADRHLQPQPPAAKSKPRRLEGVLPGFVGHRLPLPVEMMPTGLAWDARGRLYIASLKGRVWLAEDRDGDHLPDVARVFSDELAAPYGLHVGPEGVDVINKYALLRLRDADGDGRAELVQTLASGWGHTRDYHDWAVGLPRDAQGRYYISLACQQDKRSLVAARWRGTVLRLVPRRPGEQDPRLFRPEVLARGFRFPMGICFDSQGRLFVTDNQGNYTPFNELNHVLPGRWYGFPNQVERRPGAKFPPVEGPAVAMPHPWTRSVNGLCLLRTPPAVRKRLGRGVFGPYEGHLVGCEYNLQRLVRFTLQEVEGVVQGAVYPFTVPHEAESDPPLLGPVVWAVSPRGELYVGNMRDSAWGGGNNQGTVVVFRPQGRWPAGISEVLARPGGFEIRFTAPVDAKQAAGRKAYQVWSFRRVRTPAYGGDDVDRRREPVRQVHLAPDRRSVRLHLGPLRQGFVYEFHLGPLAPGGKRLWPDEAYYTLRRVPREQSP